MTDEQLQAIWQRWERSTPGEWISMYDDESTGPIVAIEYDLDGKESSSVEIALTPEGDDREADFDFIANVHQDIPALRAHIEELTAENDRLHQQLERYRGYAEAYGDFLHNLETDGR